MSKAKRDPQISFLVTEAEAAAARMTPQRRAMLNRMVAPILAPDIVQFIEEMVPLADDATELDRAFNNAMRQSMKVGFVLAVARYSRELKSNAEAMRIIGARITGGDRGRKTSSERKEKRDERIRDTWAEMERAGENPTNAKVARACGCGISTVIRAFKSKPTKRKKR
jgi:hypothetical protein